MAFSMIRSTSSALLKLPCTPAKNEKLLREDKADFLIDQNGFEQGYRPQRILADILLNEEYPQSEYLYTGMDIKTKYNL